MENYWDRKLPLLAQGPDPAADARRRDPLAQHLRPRDPARRGEPAGSSSATPKGFTPIFNGKDSTAGPARSTNYEIVDGAISCKPGKGGTIFTTKRVRATSSPGSSSGCRRAATTAWRSATRARATRPTSACASCRSSTTRRPKYAQARPAAVPRLRLRHGAAARAATCGRVGEWNFEEVTVEGLADQGRAERHAHPRRAT